MAKSTAPILVIGGVTLFNRTVELMELNNFPASKAVMLDGWKIAAATGLTAGAFALLEKVNQPLTTGVAWVALVTTLLVGIPLTNGGYQRTPIETLQTIRADPNKYMQMFREG